jgi:hypothetical protein
MARPKRPPHPMLKVARGYLGKLEPNLREAPLHLHQLDGPPGAPRYAVSVERCKRTAICPYGVTDPSRCPVFDCRLRNSLRLLLSREGDLVQVIRSGLHWED